MTFKVASYIYIAAHQSTWYWLRCSAKCTFWSFKDLNKKKERKTTPGAATPPHKQHHHHYTFLSLSTSTFYIILGPPLKAYIEVSDLSNISQRLTDLRFLSIDFLNTFLLTYRVFAEGVQVIFYERSFSSMIWALIEWWPNYNSLKCNRCLFLAKIPKGAGSFKDCFLQSRACPEPFQFMRVTSPFSFINDQTTKRMYIVHNMHPIESWHTGKSQ